MADSGGGRGVLKVLYRPVILLNQEVTNTFRCLPVADRPGGGTVRGKAALRHLNDVRKTAEFNASVLVRAFADLSRATGRGHRFHPIVPVNARKYDAFAMDGPVLGTDSENLEPAEPAAETA